jgi:hypothetical protein
MTNETALQKVIYVIRKERQSISSQLWEKQKFLGYLSALDFIERRIYEMQKDLHNERIDSITVEMQHEIKKAYAIGYEDGQEFITKRISYLMGDILDAPSYDKQAEQYFNQTFVKK